MCQPPVLPSWMHDPLPKQQITLPKNVSFLGKTMKHLASLFTDEFANNITASKNGYLQHLDPRVKILFTIFAVLLINFTHSYLTYLWLFMVSFLYSYLSKISFYRLVLRCWFIMPLFLLIASLPGIFNVFIAGKNIVTIIPAYKTSFLINGLYITDNGLLAVGRLCFRCGLTLSFSYLLLVSTRWSDLMLALSKLRIPSFFIEIIDLAYRHIFLIAKIGQQISEARLLRTVGGLSNQENRRFVGHSIAVIFMKANHLATDINFAMRLRGYKKYATLKELRMSLADYVFMFNSFFILMLILVFNQLS